MGVSRKFVRKKMMFVLGLEECVGAHWDTGLCGQRK